jgi:hypothetical protein
VSLTPQKNLSAVSLTPVNNFSTTPAINFRLFGFFSERYQRHRGDINCSPVSTTQAINFLPVSLTPLNSLSLVSLTPVIKINSRISPRIFEKIQKGSKEYLGAWGTLIHEKNLKSKISCQIPFKKVFHIGKRL